MIREASIYALKQQGVGADTAYGLRILVMRRWPRFIRRCDVDLWIPTAGPSPELLADWRLGIISWQQFSERYCEEQRRQEGCRVVSYAEVQPVSQTFSYRSLDHLHMLERQYGMLTLCCWETGPECHRYLLQQLVQTPFDEKVFREFS